MASMCGSSKSHPTLTTNSFYRPGAYPYQSDYFLPPRSAWSRVPPQTSKKKQADSSWKFGSTMLIIIAMLVLMAVLAIGGLALWMGALRTDSKTAIIGFFCSFRIVKGEKYNPMLKLNTSMVFRDKERKYKNIVEHLFRRSILGPSYKQAFIDRFENETLKVFFRLYLDRRKVPRSIANLEDTIEEIIVKETYSITSVFKDMELDLTSVSVKRINSDTTSGQRSSLTSQQRNAMITKNGILRPNKNSSLLTNSKLKTRPTKFESSEPEIDFNNVPTIQGTYKATKLNPFQNSSTVKITTTKETETSFTTPKTTSETTKSDQTTSESSITKTEISTKSTISSTTKINDELHKDFVKPDFETSPWKPIIPTFINTDLKPLTERNEAHFNPNPTKITHPFVQPVRDKELIRDEELILGTPISEVKPPDLFLNQSQITRPVNPPGMNTFDAEETDFPHDRIVPDEESKVKNNFTHNSEDHVRRPDIEISGQLPPDTFELRLKTSPESSKDIEKSHLDIITQINSQTSTVSFDRKPVSRLDDSNFSSTRPATTIDFETSELPTLLTNEKPYFDEMPLQISGIGVAEPVSDLEIDLESRNRFSEISAITDDTSLKRPDHIIQQPIYTSYRTPDLNGGARPSLVEHSGTLKPFRHTIPVDKIASVWEDDEIIPHPIIDNPKKHDTEKHLQTGVATITAVQFERNDDKTDSKHIVNGNPRVPSSSQKKQNQSPSNLERIVEFETHVKDTDTDNSSHFHLSNSSKIELSLESEEIEKSTETMNLTEEITKVETPISKESLNTSTDFPQLEISSESLRSNFSPSKTDHDSTTKKWLNSRNSTFVEINTMKHVPGKLSSTSSSVGTIEEPSLWFAAVNESSTTTLDAKRKVYNATLKANVVENNLVTLAPVKSNTGVRPIRPRPKIDKEKSTRLLEKSSSTTTTTTDTPFQALNEAALLNRLFNLQLLAREPPPLPPIGKGNITKVVKPLNHENGSVEQIIEVVTSISTKVSSSIQGNPVTLKLIVTNSSTTTAPEATRKMDITTEHKTTANKHLGITNLGNVNLRQSTTNKNSQNFGKVEIIETRSFQNDDDDDDNNKSRDKLFAWSGDDSSTMQTSDRKTSNGQQNQFLIDQLKQFADVRTVDDSGTSKPKIIKNNYNTQIKDSQQPATSTNVDELKKIADITTGNETTIFKNSSSSFTVSRDGVEVMMKVLTKKDERIDKKISTTEENILQSTEKCTGFRCSDGKCLPFGARCNMLSECTNSEDEANCTCADFLKAQLFHQKICDGVPDCWDYSDETNCVWCKEGQFVCGNNRFCIDQNKVCDGIRDCPDGEDEKKCAALIDDKIEDENSFNIPSINSEKSAKDEQIFETPFDYDQLAVESLVLESTTFQNEGNDEEKLTNNSTEADYISFSHDKNVTDVASGREIDSNSKTSLNSQNSFQTNAKDGISFMKNSNQREVYNYNDRGFLHVRKNGKWGKLCLENINNLMLEKQTSWTVEDLGRAVCKAITYQDYERVEKVKEDLTLIDRHYYSLSLNDKISDKPSLTFKPTTCPSREVLKVKCKNLECGIRTQVLSQARIVGGGSSSAGSWPWQVALYKEGDYQCGGALINDRWVLSAGHCFYHAQNEHWVARIGATRKGNFPSPHEQLLRLDYISLHPDYIDNGFINDIALLRLEAPVTFSDYVRPVCLPESEPKSGTMCTVTGWGQLFEIGRIFPDTLQEAELPLISTEDCRRKTLFLPLYRITSGMLCAGLKDGGKDACLGDSGGPLVCSESDNRFTLHGLTSNGYGCARPGRPGVYTKVYHYLPWMERTISRKEIPPMMTSCKGHRCPLGECLPKSRICNGFLECSDGSDERNCTTNQS
ncbi:uncharacterized protein LOC127276809 isoform X2 [Leptopilina boulardi]|uniref:uncharacterized protein LOC127276809 isoform X2 n=1 Tax=Leptopilina boulardi TaxID=63433 RepID=UPI0021F59D07|nr:uncharacterized protein LOC127276809 isoform X2 [Leptopilina boulardi]